MAERLEPGTIVYDPQTRKVGEYRDKAGPYAMLRPIGGGREWQADPALIRAATQEERLRAGVKALNDRFREGLGTSRQLDDVSLPPVPLPGCATCEEFAARREAARAGFDRSAETDANVLLRQHQRRDHGEATAARRRILRYVPYSIVQDPSAQPEYEAHCVSGDEAECGATSGPYGDPAEVEEWQRKHTQETRHARYRRSFADYAVLERRG
ncbi:hypothetical protein [Streptomyces sp. NL15-2K]|uniref:DUF7848 domain-containing protein n=1 Tax=Streptomyces sp. NL15-2K TaxID=376149 RepID=UPI000F56DF6C|nr:MULTISPECIES: hypothetical protein [Actinomycetes]WKX11590.1 hypothetical protein Q4V64_30395 [Kutzneria buriramensis]GCB47000.1 hypothetical protein SNL152K_4302 [Streptomyces sp. NL15-2K]